MAVSPLNNPRDIGGIENIIDLFNCMIDEKNTTYISAPITTGHRFMMWYKERGFKLDPESLEYETEHFREVIQPNKEDVKNKINDLRRQNDTGSPVLIDPTVFNWPEWTQDDYRYFWGKVIERYVKTVIFMDGWQYSSGCVFEFLTAVQTGTETLNRHQAGLDIQAGFQLIEEAIKAFNKHSIPCVYLERVAHELDSILSEESEEPVEREKDMEESVRTPPVREFVKDEVLNRLAMMGNVAQFVSFGLVGTDNELSQRFSRVFGFKPNHYFSSPKKAIEYLIQKSPEGTVNIRSFQPGKVKGEPLHYGLNCVDNVLDILYKKASENKFTIVNETVDINDGGVSGVTIGEVLEFSPGDTPKCVEKPGVCRLPRGVGLKVLETVYGFRPTLNFPLSQRVEFSIHPKKRGIRHGHTIVWELEEVNAPDTVPEIHWPNNFSRLLGDKAYGLLIADTLGLPVPMTTVITRNISPFTFGIKTGTGETWMRTCPEVRSPGEYPTYFGWRDPFQLMSELNSIASVLAQEAVNPEYSGSLVPGQPEGKEPFIEGVRGMGDSFMVGGKAPEELPGEVKKAVRDLYLTAFKQLGPIEIEWVYDGKKAWLVQLHKSEAFSVGGIVYPGEAGRFIKFNIAEGLEALRALIPAAKEDNAGIILVGDIGITSHFGDLLRRAKVPARVMSRLD